MYGDANFKKGNARLSFFSRFPSSSSQLPYIESLELSSATLNSNSDRSLHLSRSSRQQQCQMLLYSDHLYVTEERRSSDGDMGAKEVTVAKTVGRILHGELSLGSIGGVMQTSFKTWACDVRPSCPKRKITCHVQHRLLFHLQDTLRT